MSEVEGESLNTVVDFVVWRRGRGFAILRSAVVVRGTEAEEFCLPEVEDVGLTIVSN